MAIKPTQQSNNVSKITLKYLFTSIRSKRYITPLNEGKTSDKNDENRVMYEIDGCI